MFPPRIGGSGRWFWELYRRCPVNSTVVLAGVVEGQERFDARQPLQILRAQLTFPTWGILDSDSRLLYWQAIKQVTRIVNEHKIESIHAGKCLPEGLIALALRCLLGIPYICYVHGEELSVAASSRELRIWTRLVLRSSRCIIANTYHTQRKLENEWGVRINRSFVVHPGVDLDLHRPVPKSLEVRESLGWARRTVLITVGRLEKWKGQDRMIDALHQIRSKLPDILYVIIGNGPERQRLQAQVALAGLVEHVQFQDNWSSEQVIKALQQCDLFVLPNREINGCVEGFGIVLLEAQACGTPVLAGASGGTVETMSAPETGRVVRCEDAEVIACAVLELLSNPRSLEEMGERARRWVTAEFNWEDLAGHWRRSIDSSIDPWKPRRSA